MERTTEEIELQINLANENLSIFPGMSYADGVRDALSWVTGETDDLPIDPEEI